jgi:selenocysteine-specific elongation factor
MTSAQVAAALGVPRPVVADELNKAKLERVKVGTETAFITAEALDGLVGEIEREILAFHEADSRATGLATSALRDRVDRRLTAKAFDAVLEVAQQRGLVIAERGQVRHPKAAVSAIAQEAEAREKLVALLATQGLAPAGVRDLASEAGVDPGIARKVLGQLASEGVVVRVSSEMHFSADAMAAARASLTSHLEAHPEGASAADLRDALGVSRKYAIPLLEYFDAQGVTRREGDLRVLRRS